MTNKNTIKAFAAQLDSLNLDRAETILEAASLLADMAERLTSTEQDADFYRAQANDLQNLVQEARKQIEQNAESLPRYLSDIVDMAMTQQRKAQATESGKARAKQDPRTKEREFIFERWVEWKTKYPKRYKSNTQFAMVMLLKCKKLKSVKTIADWCGEWNKAHNPASSAIT